MAVVAKTVTAAKFDLHVKQQVSTTQAGEQEKVVAERRSAPLADASTNLRDSFIPFLCVDKAQCLPPYASTAAEGRGGGGGAALWSTFRSSKPPFSGSVSPGIL